MPLADEDCRRIHEAALEVLAETGVRVDDPEVVRLLADAGATIRDGNVARIPTAGLGELQ